MKGARGKHRWLNSLHLGTWNANLFDFPRLLCQCEWVLLSFDSKV